MKLYIKDGVIRTRNRIVLIIDGKQLINPTEEDILADGWVEYVEKKKLESVKIDKIREIEDYDHSSSVNECFISYGGQQLPYWASKSERDDLKGVINDYILLGEDSYRLDLRELMISINIKCNDLLKMLSVLEFYASKCYNKTTDHIFAVNNLQTIEEVENYDYTQGYPNKLTFEL
jgi:hypothetical protein